MAPLTPFPWIDVAIILALVALNGVFAMSELAIVSARKARLEAMARSGSKGAAAAILLAADPGKFLSTVQIGITLIGDDRRAPIRVPAWAGRPPHGWRRRRCA